MSTLNCERCGVPMGTVEKLRAAEADNERLRALLHDIAVARRGDCPDVDENWDLLPCEIEQMWQWR